MLINLLSSRNFRTYVVGIIMRYGVYHQTQYNKPSFSESVREKIWWTEHKRPENINIKQISDVPYNMYLFYVVRRLVLKVLTWQCIALTKTHDIHMYERFEVVKYNWTAMILLSVSQAHTVWFFDASVVRLGHETIHTKHSSFHFAYYYYTFHKYECVCARTNAQRLSTRLWSGSPYSTQAHTEPMYV